MGEQTFKIYNMKKYIELLDYCKRPLHERAGVIKCDNRMDIDNCFRAVIKTKPNKKARYMQLLIGKSPNEARAYLHPVAI